MKKRNRLFKTMGALLYNILKAQKEGRTHDLKKLINSIKGILDELYETEQGDSNE